MHIIYYSARPSLLPQVAAFLHCQGIFKFGPSVLEKPAEYGCIRQFGKDSWENQIFYMHCNKGAPLIERMLKGFSELLWENTENLLLVDTSETENPFTKVGFFLLYRLGAKMVGEKIIKQGIVLSLPELQGLVEGVRLRIQLKNK